MSKLDIENPVVDTILPPVLAYQIGLDFSKRAKDIREGRTTLEGRYISRHSGRTCDCMEEPDPVLTDRHPKGRGVSSQIVRNLFSQKG